MTLLSHLTPPSTATSVDVDRQDGLPRESSKASKEIRNNKESDDGGPASKHIDDEPSTESGFLGSRKELLEGSTVSTRDNLQRYGSLRKPQDLSPSAQTATTALPSPNAQPSICVTGVMLSDGDLTVTRTLSNGQECALNLHYTIFRPRQVKVDRFVWSPPPLIVLHGGPGVPCNYLLSLVNVVTDRAVIFYDQIGCGRSSRPMDIECYSIQTHVEDLTKLIETLIPEDRGFSLYGHSFGGIVAFEYLKKNRNPCDCLSVILSSVPTQTWLVEEESQILLDEIQDEHTSWTTSEVVELFQRTHECRAVDPTPLGLTDAYAQSAKVWRGVEAILDYEAEIEKGEPRIRVPCLIMRGQYDFVTQRCVQDWDKLFRYSDSMTLAGCSHHALLENEPLYGDVVSAFLQEHDPPQNFS